MIYKSINQSNKFSLRDTGILEDTVISYGCLLSTARTSEEKITLPFVLDIFYDNFTRRALVAGHQDFISLKFHEITNTIFKSKYLKKRHLILFSF